MTDPMFRYRLFGLVIASEIMLPALFAAEPDGPADVQVRRGVVEAGSGAPPGYAVTEHGTILTIPDMARYLIRDGREIIVDAASSASERNVRLFLLGSAVGALLHQRGLLPLHANAIDVGGRVVAFSGHSGAGKSTIAAWFHDRGYRLLSDDVCVIVFEKDRPMAYPGLPRLRLWREALEASGRTAEDYDLSFDDLSKYDVPTERRVAEAALPLDRVYMLKRAEEPSAELAIRRIRGIEAVDSLVSNTYRGAYLRSIGRTRDHLMTCARLASSVPIFSAERVWGFAGFDRQSRLLERHALAAPGPEDS